MPSNGHGLAGPVSKWSPVATAPSPSSATQSVPLNAYGSSFGALPVCE
jgi:hypothetical protein